MTMAKSPIQEPFIEELVASTRASRSRLLKKFSDGVLGNLQAEQVARLDAAIWPELTGMLHGFLATLDGSTGLADTGRVFLTDENGNAFDRHLHELAFDTLTDDKRRLISS